MFLKVAYLQINIEFRVNGWKKLDPA